MWKDFQYELSLYFWDLLSPSQKTMLEIKIFWHVVRAQLRRVWKKGLQSFRM